MDGLVLYDNEVYICASLADNLLENETLKNYLVFIKSKDGRKKLTVKIRELKKL